MDTHNHDMHAATLLLTAPASHTPQVAAGRMPLMAFVDGETERVLQECSVLLGRCVIMRGGIAKAIEFLGEQRSPHLLIVDISGIDLPLSQIQMLAEVCEPGTNVVALGDHNDVGLYQDLLDSGISQYIVKPLTREGLARAVAPRPGTSDLGKAGVKLGKVISFAGSRGGVGTTTLAGNLAWYLANGQVRRVALIDLDLHTGDCGLLFGIGTIPGLRDALNNPLRLDHLLLDRLMTKVGERLFVLGSEEPLETNVQITAAAVDALFSVLRSQFHYVIVDVPRIPAPAYRRALEMADRRVIVVDPTMRSMRDCVRLTRQFESTDGTETGTGDRVLDTRNVFVVNRVGEAGSNALSLRDVEMVLRAKPTSQIPFLPRLVTPAAHHAIAATSKRSKFADGISTLALEITGRQQRRTSSFWRRAR
jgi:pilus assembly protein CpaE